MISNFDEAVKQYAMIYFRLLDMGIREFRGESGTLQKLSVYVTEATIGADFRFRPRDEVEVRLSDFARFFVCLESDTHMSLMDGAL